MDSGSKDGPSSDINRIASMQATKLFARLSDLNIRIPKAAKLANIDHPVSALSLLNQSVYTRPLNRGERNKILLHVESLEAAVIAFCAKR